MIRERRLFTHAEAEALLPLVESIAADMVRDFEALSVVGRAVRSFPLNGTGDLDAVRELIEDRDRLAKRNEAYLAELDELGVECRDLSRGVIDFPALVEGDPAYLTWRHGEGRRITAWHRADEGYTNARPVPAEVMGAT